MGICTHCFVRLMLTAFCEDKSVFFSETEQGLVCGSRSLFVMTESESIYSYYSFIINVFSILPRLDLECP